MIVLLTYLLALLAPVHNIHVSNTEIELRGEDKIEVTVRIFTDDLQNAVGLKPGELPTNYRGADELIQKYMNQVLRLESDGKKVDLTYEESIASGDAIWIYYSATLKPDGHEITLYNAVLHDLFNDQKNMVRVLGERKQIFVLDKKNTSTPFFLN